MKEQVGAEAYDSALASLTIEDREMIPSVLLDSNWYPFDIWRILRRLARILIPHAGTEFAIDMGKYMAEKAFTGVYKSLLANDPVKQAEKFPWINDLLYKDTRTVDVTVRGKSGCHVRYHYLPDVNPRRSTCLSSMGIWIRLLEMTGAKNVKAAHTKCVIDKNESCEFTFEWN